MILFQIKNLTKNYGKKDAVFQALSDITFNINEGESVAIIGKSGSGKSTLMHILAGLDKPSSGEVLFKGQDLSNAKDIDKIRNESFGFVFQQFFLNPRDSVSRNVELPLKIGGMPTQNRESKINEVLKAVELVDKKDNLGSNLSGGQKQRVCIARALVNNPSVIFADEPTGNLDSKTGKQIEDLLFNLNKQKKITLVIVTHDEDLAKRCSKIIKITDGKLVA